MGTILETSVYRVIEGRHGRFLVNPNDVYIGQSIIQYGEYSEGELKLLRHLVSESGVIIEAGANIGAHTVPLARKVGRRGLIYAFEPQLLVFQQLCANLALNDLVNVQAFNAGCGSQETVVGINRHDPAKEANFGGLPISRIRADTSPIKIAILQLDAVVDPPRLDLIKADVEGMEIEVLLGATQLIEQFRPILYVENNDLARSANLIKFMEENNYTCWWDLPAMFRADNYLNNKDNIYEGIISMNMICFPSEKRVRLTNRKQVLDSNDHPKLWKSKKAK